MAGVSGPELDELVDHLAQWVNDMTDWLVEQLSEGYPFDSTPLSEIEQLNDYLAMKRPEDWAPLIGRIEALHHGKPNARALVQADLNSYVGRMETLLRKFRGE